jgi:hypothetical protein
MMLSIIGGARATMRVLLRIGGPERPAHRVGGPQAVLSQPKEKGMSSPLSLDQIVSRLEQQIAFHREKEAYHAGQEGAHRDQRALHAAELETLTQSLEALKAIGATAASLASRSLPTDPAASPPDPDAGRPLTVAQMVARVVEARGPEEVFGPNLVTQELNRRYQDRLRHPVPERVVSVNLRRLLDAGRLRALRKGRPHHEALFARA